MSRVKWNVVVMCVSFLARSLQTTIWINSRDAHFPTNRLNVMALALYETIVRLVSLPVILFNWLTDMTVWLISKLITKCGRSFVRKYAGDHFQLGGSPRSERHVPPESGRPIQEPHVSNSRNDKLKVNYRGKLPLLFPFRVSKILQLTDILLLLMRVENSY